MPAILAEITAYAFWALIIALVGSRFTLFGFKLLGRREKVARLASVFNHYTAYLRP